MGYLEALTERNEKEPWRREWLAQYLHGVEDSFERLNDSGGGTLVEGVWWLQLKVRTKVLKAQGTLSFRADLRVYVLGRPQAHLGAAH